MSLTAIEDLCARHIPQRKAAMAEEGKPLTFVQFVERVAPRFVWYPFLLRVADVLQDVADRKIKRVLFFWPPRHGKSETVSRLFSAYWLYRYPEEWVGLASYSADLAEDLSENAREYYLESGRRVRRSASAKKKWRTLEGGGMWARGVGGSITGLGYSLGIVDDPIKGAEEAGSKVVRKKLIEWFQSVFLTRAAPDDALIIIQTRWHEEDLAGHVLKQEIEAAQEGEDGTPERWHIVNLPAILPDPREGGSKPDFPITCTLQPDPRKPGEALCEERYPVSKLLRLKKRIGAYFFEALFQQRPTPQEGSIFKVGRFDFQLVAPVGLPTARCWDVAATKDGGDLTAGVKISGPDAWGIYYIEDAVWGQYDIEERDALIKRTAWADGPTVRQIVPEDPGSAGKAQSAAFVKLLAGLPVEVFRPTKSKEVYAAPMASQVNAGNFVIIRGPWNAEFIEFFRVFPNGVDDPVDAGSGAFNAISGGFAMDGAVGGPSR
ncbi:MAG: phage terminase large subunit [Fimbriimonas sp.]